MATVCGSLRVTLVAGFGFLPQNGGMWSGPMNGTLSFYECSWSSGNSMRWWRYSNPTCYNPIYLKFVHSKEGIRVPRHHSGISCIKSHLVKLFTIFQTQTLLSIKKFNFIISLKDLWTPIRIFPSPPPKQ